MYIKPARNSYRLYQIGGAGGGGGGDNGGGGEDIKLPSIPGANGEPGYYVILKMSMYKPDRIEFDDINVNRMFLGETYHPTTLGSLYPNTYWSYASNTMTLKSFIGVQKLEQGQKLLNIASRGISKATILSYNPDKPLGVLETSWTPSQTGLRRVYPTIAGPIIRFIGETVYGRKYEFESMIDTTLQDFMVSAGVWGPEWSSGHGYQNLNSLSWHTGYDNDDGTYKLLASFGLPWERIFMDEEYAVFRVTEISGLSHMIRGGFYVESSPGIGAQSPTVYSVSIIQ